MSIYKNDKLIYVAQCVDSLLKQTFKDFHVYVQYDGVVESGIEDRKSTRLNSSHAR